MGTTSSKTAEPFAISDAANTELNRLSFIAARFLGSSDLYDVENLSKPGTCGNYSIFLRKGIEATLLPFVVDLSDGKTAEVYYQDPRKAIGSQEILGKICKQLTKTMVRAIATVTAALASIQVVKSRSRDVIVATAVQKGGGIRDIGDWLETTGYIPAGQSAFANKPIPFQVPGGRYPTLNVRFTLTLERSEGILSYGLFNVEGLSSQYSYPTGSLRVHFLYTTNLPGTSKKSVLPIRVVDKAGLTWFAGVLIDEKFKSFVEGTPEIYVTRLLERLFITAAGGSVPDAYPETRAQLKMADSVFHELHRSNNDVNVLVRAMNRYFTETVPGYQQPLSVPGYPGAAYPAPAYPVPGYPAPAYPVPGYPYQQPVYGQQPQAQARPLSYGLGLGQGQGQGLGLGPVTFRQMGPDGQYDIQGNASMYIRKIFDSFRRLIATQSCPAEERAAALFGAGYDEKQFIRTGVCGDSYWKKTNLSDIHPWASFQFLSIKNWDKAGDRSDNYDSTWNEFINDLEVQYGKEHFSRPSGTSSLDQMRFTNMDKFVSCSLANPGPVFEGINALRTLYDKHNTIIWGLVNDLVVRIKHPETNKDIIRLHPNVISGGKSSATYVEGKAAAVRSALKNHYLEVEKTYIRIIRGDQFIKKVTG